MKLATNELSSALAGTKNPVLQDLANKVSLYDSLPPSNAAGRAAALDDIAADIGLYMTKRHPKYAAGVLDNASKNIRRREQLYKLGDRVNQEFAALQLRPLTGSFQKVDERNYWLERIDPKHRSGHRLLQPFQDWYANATLSTKSDFFAWVDNNSWNYGGLLDEVLYITDADAARRMFFQVTFSNDGRMLNADGDPFATKDLQTLASGEGWAITVMSFNDEIYMGPHYDSEFHHSSFLGGKPCRFAGEIVTDDNGRLFLLTGKSGHYKSTPAEVKRVCEFLQQKGAVGSDTLVRPDMLDFRSGSPVSYKNSVKVYRMREWMRDPKNCKPMLKNDIRSRIPNPGMTINASSLQHFFDNFFTPTAVQV